MLVLTLSILSVLLLAHLHRHHLAHVCQLLRELQLQVVVLLALGLLLSRRLLVDQTHQVVGHLEACV